MNRALPPLGFPAGAAFVRMHPKMSASAIIASQAGQFQIIDINNPATLRLYHANVTSYVTAMELAPSGDALALMDADGYVQLWGAPEKMRFTELMNPVEWYEDPPRPGVTVNDDTSVVSFPPTNYSHLANGCFLALSIPSECRTTTTSSYQPGRHTWSLKSINFLRRLMQIY